MSRIHDANYFADAVTTAPTLSEVINNVSPWEKRFGGKTDKVHPMNDLADALAEDIRARKKEKSKPSELAVAWVDGTTFGSVCFRMAS